MRPRPSSLLIAVLVGAGAGAMTIPTLQRRVALQRIASADAAVAADAWSRLLRDPARIATRLDDINDRLHAAPDAAVLEAGVALRRARLWGWSHQPVPLIAREIELRLATGDPIDAAVAVELLATAPLGLEPAALERSWPRAVAHPDSEVRAGALCAASGWAGRTGGAWLERLGVPADDIPLRRVWTLALAWTDRGPGVVDEHAGPRLLEAQLVRHVLAGGDLGRVTGLLDRLDDADPPALEDILRRSPDPAAATRLREMADGGNRTARFALQTVQPALEDEAARRVASNESAPPWRRRLALWRLDRAPERLVRIVLELPPAEPDGSVYAAALLAERRLHRADAIELATGWIRDLDDDRKRAGAVLAALLGEPAELLRRAYEREDMPGVRTTQRLALAAMGIAAGTENPRELAWRARHRPDGTFAPDVVTLELLAGMADALDVVTTRPARPDREAVQPRAWLVERFVPEWHEAAGRPVGGAAATVDLHLDLLRARWLLVRRRVRFDRPTAVFRETPPPPDDL